MSIGVFLLWLGTVSVVVHAALPPPRGYLVNCGSSNEVEQGGLKYGPDEGYISVGNKTTLTKQPDLHPLLLTLRFFPDTSARKYCYAFPVIKGAKFLVKTTYYYGDFDGADQPPVFDQIIDGTKWSVVDTTEDYRAGLSSYYEIVVTAHAKTLSVCLARNKDTRAGSSPFISGIEVDYLEDSLYNSTDFGKYALITVARNSFGYSEGIIGFPDDQFNRYWQPFTDDNPVVGSHSNVTSSEFWNMPPSRALSNSITTSRGKPLTLRWPSFPLPICSNCHYYIALYFQDNRTPSPYSWRVFSVTLNGKKFYSDLNVTTNGVSVYGSLWPLSGQTEIVMTPAHDSPVGPIISAGEILQVVPLGGRTLTRDVTAMEDLARSFDNPPADWRGDPCLPKQNSWTGVTCSEQGNFARVTTLNLTGVGLSGTLPESIDMLTALTNLWLGGNQLSGAIPEMISMKTLQTLHLENNKFEGSIPKSLGELPNLSELFLQNNELSGTIPDNLKNRNGINIQISPGNHLSQ